LSKKYLPNNKVVRRAAIEPTMIFGIVRLKVNSIQKIKDNMKTVIYFIRI